MRLAPVCFALCCVPLLLVGVSSAQADTYSFNYIGINDPAVYGTGTFTTGTPYGDGYLPIIAITGTTEAGTITGLIVSGGTGTDPANGSYLYCCAYDYDNSFSPTGLNGGNPFSSTGGPLFGVELLADTPINLFGDGLGNTYEFSYGEDTPNFNIPSYGGTPIDFTATLTSLSNGNSSTLASSGTPEPGFYGALALGLIGLLFAGRRRLVSITRTKPANL